MTNFCILGIVSASFVSFLIGILAGVSKGRRTLAEVTQELAEHRKEGIKEATIIVRGRNITIEQRKTIP